MHLHLHSTYSVLDGRGQIKDYVKLAVEDKQEALAITDHGTLGGIIEGYKACKDAGIKFIAGQEMYVDVAELRENDYPGHLTVLARNESGYRALIAANNLAHRQFYYRPRITLQQIIEKGFAKDWIILSGCLSSPLYNTPHAESVEIIKQLALNSSAFFLEFMWHYSEDPVFNQKQDTYLQKMADFHKATDLPMVITNDCHYSHAHHETLHRQLLSQSAEPEGLEFDGLGFYFKTMKSMQAIADSLGIPNAVDNAVEIGKMCDLHIPEADQVNWYVPDITGGKPEETLRSLCADVLVDMAQYDPPEVMAPYYERYEYELGVLKTSPAILNSYLVTHDVVSWCHERNIPVAARGSMGGSLISWLLGITLEDPIKYRLSFSRAVNPARPTIPDFDLDVSSIHRPAILDYLRQRYENNTGIAAYSHYGPKGAFRKILRMEGIREFQDINELVKPLPEDWADGDFEYSPTAKVYIGKESWFDSVPEQYRSYVAIYQGLYSSMSAHPSGILVGGPERELEHEVPLQWIASSKQLVSAYDMYTLKKLGLFKLDVLGLRTLDQLAYMETKSGARIPNDDYDDPNVLAAFGTDLLAEIFQMDGYACRSVLRDIGGAETFEDIIAANTLARPGCAQFTPYYRSGYEGLMRQYPQVADVLGPTNGLILYQEQVMEIARVLADFDDSEQDDVKEAIKYFRHEVWSKTIEPKFRERVEAKGKDPQNMLDAIARMASYTYNRAHAMTYAAIAYKMMWYKIYHPAVYYAAVYDAADDKQRLILESHNFNVKWHPADVNYSEAETTVRDGEIYLGLAAIKGVGPSACEALAAARPFTSLEDLLARVEKKRCNKTVINKLQEAFALSSIGVQGKISSFQEYFGFNYRFLDNELISKIKVDKFDPYSIAGFITNIHALTIKKVGSSLLGKEMCQISLVNSFGKTKCVLFPDVWGKAKGKLYTGQAIQFTGQSQVSGDFIVEHAHEFE